MSTSKMEWEILIYNAAKWSLFLKKNKIWGEKCMLELIKNKKVK